MDYAQAFAVSAAGMTLERSRVDVAALNLANANTLITGDGVGFQPLRVVARVSALALPSFADEVDRGLQSLDLSNVALPQAIIEPAGVQPRRVYQPESPFADAQGYLSYPGVDTATEMLSLMTALRGYEANVAAMNTSRTLVLKTLDIGGPT